MRASTAELRRRAARRQELEERAFALPVRFDPRLHPRGRTGKFSLAPHLARVRSGRGGQDRADRADAAEAPRPAAPAGTDFSEAKPEAFLKALQGNTRAWNLTQHERDHLERSTLLLSGDGKTGCLVAPDGDLQNVFNNGGAKGAGGAAVELAVERGARTLDCYDGYLPRFYGGHGFVETGRMRFDTEMAPDGWDVGELDHPDVVFMAWRGDAPGPRRRERRYYGDWDEAKGASRKASASR